MILLHYTKYGTNINDFKVEEFVDRIIEFHKYSNSDEEFWFSNALVIYAVRLRVAKGELLPDDVVFYFDDPITGEIRKHRVTMNKRGMLTSYGYMPNFITAYSVKLLKRSIGKED